MKRHKPRKSNPCRKLRQGEKVPVKTEFTIESNQSGRSYWLHPRKGWRSQGPRP